MSLPTRPPGLTEQPGPDSTVMRPPPRGPNGCMRVLSPRRRLGLLVLGSCAGPRRRQGPFFTRALHLDPAAAAGPSRYGKPAKPCLEVGRPPPGWAGLGGRTRPPTIPVRPHAPVRRGHAGSPSVRPGRRPPRGPQLARGPRRSWSRASSEWSGRPKRAEHGATFVRWLLPSLSTRPCADSAGPRWIGGRA